MSINTLPSNSILNPRRITPNPFVPVGDSVPPTAYVRPADWPALSSLSSTLIFSGLLAVNNTSMEYIAINISGTGTLTVDWGDGTSETLTTAVTKQHLYNYATLGTSVTSRGYKTALINVTTTGTITAINLQVRPTPVSPQLALPGSWGAKWLDIQLGSSDLITLNIGGTTPYLLLLEQASVTSVNASFNSMNVLFQNCYNIQSCPTLNFSNVTPARPATSMFQNCYNLVIAPTFDTSRISSFNTMFQGCVKLQTVPVYTLTSALTFLNTFNACYSLRTFPSMSYPIVTSMSNMFSNCTNLEYLQPFNVGTTLTNTSFMFNGCNSLKAAPYINTINVTLFDNMFTNCFLLTTVPLYNYQNMLTCPSMFSNCYSLLTLPGPMNFAKCTDPNGMFTNCYSLKVAPSIINSSLMTTTLNMFNTCYSLTTVPLFDTSNVINMGAMFTGCTSLITIPLFNTIKVTSMASMFSGCTILKTIPSFNTANVIGMSSMFLNCRTIQTIPSLNTSNVTSTVSMFNGCTGLINVPALDFTKVNTMATMFSSCASLKDASNIANTGNVANMNGTFQSCNSLNSLPPAWDTTKVTDWSNFVNNSLSLTSIPTYNTSNALNITSFAASTNSLVTIPALNFQNVTTAGSIFSGGITTLINCSNLRVSHNITGTAIGQTDLQNYTANLGSNTTAQTLTITGVPGATTAIAKTANTVAGSNVVIMANTVGVLVGTYLYGVGITTGITVTFTDSTDRVSYTNSPSAVGVQNNDSVMFTSISGTTGIVINTQYFVVNRSSASFQLSATSGGAVLPLTTNGSGVMNVGGATISNQVVTVNANANVVINGATGLNGNAVVFSSRALNQNYLTTKNWTLSG